MLTGQTITLLGSECDLDANDRARVDRRDLLRLGQEKIGQQVEEEKVEKTHAYREPDDLN